MTTDTREMILTAARTTVQAHGYSGLSFRDLAKDVGIKSASVHYHFPTKSDLGATLAHLYTQNARADLDRVLAETHAPAACLRLYVGFFRKALEHDNRMCLCGIMGAEYDALPDAVKAEVRGFADTNVAWLTQVLARLPAPKAPDAIARWGLAIFAAIGGAQLAARSRNDIAAYDQIIEGYAASGLLPI